MKGLSEFINNITESKPFLPKGLIKDLESFIINSGCTSIRFEDMSSKALGLSNYDECILGYKLLKLQFEYVLYIVMHEVVHQYQYKKYGKDVALEIYKSNISLDEAVDKLLYLEKTADRLAIAKLKQLLKKHKVTSNVEIKPRYLNISNTDYFKKYVTEVRREAVKNNYTTIEDINSYMYNRIKKVELV
jgi:hypothetical protein